MLHEETTTPRHRLTKHSAPFATGLILFVSTLIWASTQKSLAQEREFDQLVRYTESLARGLAIVAERYGDGPEQDEDLRREDTTNLAGVHIADEAIVNDHCGVDNPF